MRRRIAGPRRLLLVGLVSLLATAGLGCAEFYVGQPSFSLISVAPTRDQYESIGSVRTASDCASSYLFLFGNGDPPSHEAVLSRLLAEADADVLLNARLTTERVSLLVFRRDCAVVRGQPARRVEASS